MRHLEGHYADCITASRQRLAHLGLSHVLIVLLDISKNVHWATVSLASGLELVKPHRFPTTKAGFIQFIQMTNALINEHSPLLILLGHEPTGVYH